MTARTSRSSDSPTRDARVHKAFGAVAFGAAGGV